MKPLRGRSPRIWRGALLVAAAAVSSCTQHSLQLPRQYDPPMGAMIASAGYVGDGDQRNGVKYGVEWAWPIEGVVLVPTLSRIEYEWEDDDGSYEEGSGYGAGLYVRWYPERPLKGFYAGIGTTIFPWFDWELSTPFGSDRGNQVAFDYDLECGWSFVPAERWRITPFLRAGNFWSDSDNDGFYGSLGCRVSIGF